ncbi:hypothetical protein FRC10_006894 [Ceratobasidium sp. 414]|nr:hypothetical protein FRC10_006894 [Ceratobasidium sp. 414]
MTSTVRQRKAFNFSEDGEKIEDEGHILDEQEQEGIIDELRQAAKRSNHNSTVAITGILVLGIVS